MQEITVQFQLQHTLDNADDRDSASLAASERTTYFKRNVRRRRRDIISYACALWETTGCIRKRDDCIHCQGVWSTRHYGQPH